jgi:excisionase family DNA binding protein
MTLSLREAAEQAGTSKSTIWRAIKSGRMSAARTDDGGFAIDPAELFRAFEPKRPEQHSEGQDTIPTATPMAPAATDETASRIAALDAEVKGLRDLLAEVRASREELRQDRDIWRGQIERLALPAPIPEPRKAWWRRLAG